MITWPKTVSHSAKARAPVADARPRVVVLEVAKKADGVNVVETVVANAHVPHDEKIRHRSLQALMAPRHRVYVRRCWIKTSTMTHRPQAGWMKSTEIAKSAAR